MFYLKHSQYNSQLYENMYFLNMIFMSVSVKNYTNFVSQNKEKSRENDLFHKVFNQFGLQIL
jgi:hypothetical protein